MYIQLSHVVYKHDLETDDRHMLHWEMKQNAKIPFFEIFYSAAVKLMWGFFRLPETLWYSRDPLECAYSRIRLSKTLNAVFARKVTYCIYTFSVTDTFILL